MNPKVINDKKISRKEFITVVGGFLLLFVARNIPTNLIKSPLAKTLEKDGYGNNQYGGSRKA